MTAQDIVERALALPGAHAGRVVVVTETSEAVLRWANSTMTTNGHTTSRDVSVVAMVPVEGGTAAGVVSSSAAVTDLAQLEALLRAAEHAARDAGPARDAMPLPEPVGDDPGWADPAAETSIGVYDRFARDLGEVLAGPQRHYGFASHELTTTWLGTSTGVRRRWVAPTGSVELNVKTPDLTSSAWTGASTVDFTDVDVVALAARAAARLEWGRRRVTLEPGRYETLLPPSAMADLAVNLVFSMDGRPAQEGHSAFAGRVGERLTELPLTLACDPHAKGLEYAPFLATTHSADGISVFDNGAALTRTEWVRSGVISELAYSRAEAAEFGPASGAEFAPLGDNLLLTGGSDASLEDLVGRTERGLLLTCLWYIREVDPATLLLTGLTRDGVYLVEGGEVVAEVDHNFRFNYSPLDVLRTATEVGATERILPREWKDWFTRAAMPPVRVPEFHMSSVSPGR